jgi:hypothetical protein
MLQSSVDEEKVEIAKGNGLVEVAGLQLLFNTNCLYFGQ